MVPWADPGGEFYFSLGAAGAQAAGLWAGGGAPANNAPAGRATTYGIIVNSGGNINTKNLGVNYTSFIQGVAYYFSSNAFASNDILMRFMDGATTQIELRTSGTGQLFFARNGTAISSTSTQALQAGWHYIEVKATINSTTGSVEVRVDTVVWVTATGQNTQNTANNFISRVEFRNLPSGFLKDMVFIDTSTGINTNYLGDVTVGVFFANASGANTQWTPNPNQANFINVQDGINHTGTWPDGDTTYNSSATAGQLDDYAHQSISLTGSIFCVLHVSYLRKDDAGARTVAQYVISGGSGVVLTANISLGNSYLYYFQVLEQDPNGNITWTATAFNNMTGGCKLIS